MAHKYTEEQSNFIKENVKGRKSFDLSDMFNNNFQLDLKPSQIRAFIKNHNLKSGLDCRFTKGSVPYNKGLKGVGGWEPTQFKKGNRPHKHITVGSERVNGDGYIDIKVADPNQWKGKHKYSIAFEIGSFMLVRCLDETDMYEQFENCWNDDVYPLSQYYWDSNSEEDCLGNCEVVGNI